MDFLPRMALIVDHLASPAQPPVANEKATSKSVIAAGWSFSGFGGKLTSAVRKLGPGLITGASDDDPSGIATYSQVGAQVGYGTLWTMVLSYPLMAVIQEISARAGRVTGGGIAANLRKHYPRAALFVVTALVLVANIFNLGADIGAMVRPHNY